MGLERDNTVDGINPASPYKDPKLWDLILGNAASITSMNRSTNDSDPYVRADMGL